MARKSIRVKKAGTTPPVGIARDLDSVTGAFSVSALAAQIPGNTEGVTGAIAADGQITIVPLSGESFGTAEIECVLFDDFRNSTTGVVPSTSAVVGTWTSTGGTTDDSTTKIGTKCWHKTGGSLRLNSFGAATGCRVSYHIRATVNDDGISAGRSKTSWLMDTPSGFESDDKFDLAFPTKMAAGTTGWGVAGNDGNLLQSHGAWLVANEWQTVMFSFGRDGGWRFHTVGATRGLNEKSGTANIFNMFPLSTTMDTLHVGTTTDHDYRYDGLMVHKGLGANACVEIGDAATYSSCTQLFDMQIDSWATSQIVATCRLPSSSFAGWYLHIHDANRAHVGGGTGRLIGGV